MKCRRVLISGNVQGVGYRYFARRKARFLGLSGWVKNLDDGSVDLIIQGGDKEVDEMLEWCKEGSPLARVGSVDIKGEPVGDYEDF